MNTKVPSLKDQGKEYDGFTITITGDKYVSFLRAAADAGGLGSMPALLRGSATRAVTWSGSENDDGPVRSFAHFQRVIWSITPQIPVLVC